MDKLEMNSNTCLHLETECIWFVQLELVQYFLLLLLSQKKLCIQVKLQC